MRVFGLLISLLTLPAFAGIDLTTQILDIDYGQKPDDDVLVFLGSGHVAKIRRSDDFLSSKKMLLNKNQWHAISLDDDRYIISMEKTENPSPIEPILSHAKRVQLDYTPTTIPDMKTAKDFFRRARYNPKDSQCFNRAHVWSFEWWRESSLQSNKILIFFTRNYIRRYNFEWWFHIAPYVHVQEGDKVVERVMDRKYSSGPIDFRRWTNIFMNKDPECPVITKYSDYADYPYNGDCFIMRTHMFTYQPADLQMYEAWNYSKDSFNMDEVRGAYLEAFDQRI